MTKVNNTFYVTNGSSLFILDTQNWSLQFVRNFQTRSLRLYNLFDQLVVRNVTDSRFYIQTETGFSHQFSFEDFNLMFACKQYLIGFQRAQINKITYMVTIRDNQLVIIQLKEYSDLIIESSTTGLKINANSLLKLTGLTSQELSKQNENEIHTIEECKKELEQQRKQTNKASKKYY
ncbi:Hypothetical_protein [Hexamita inflata]|uniref:Hypothetical_protein n=1 Tax=Hexamita inflata TaxID=28002 RepID=A0AA86UHR8_9EUKA|nr:Hypothetical protein HINF_LOCUS40021 [Hexamita inflata]